MTISMKIWVDADGCPGEIKEIIVRAADRTKVLTIFVANRLIQLPKSSYLQSVRVQPGFNVADSYIVENVSEGDLVVSSDVPLAALLVPKGATILTTQGQIMNEQNISERLSVRNFLEEVRSGGTITGGPKPFDHKTKQKFAAMFDKEIVRLVKIQLKAE